VAHCVTNKEGNLIPYVIVSAAPTVEEARAFSPGAVNAFFELT
jgi:hypothetical protein